MALEELINTIESKLDKEINLFNLGFAQVLKEIKTQVEAQAIMSIKEPLTFDYKFQQILKDSGYFSLVDDFIDNSYDKTYKDILKVFALGGLETSFTNADLDYIKQIKLLDAQVFRDIGNQAANILKRDLYKYYLSNMKISDISKNISQALDGTDLAKYSTTYAETSISTFNQSIIDLKAKDFNGVWIYVGVNDSKTRPFCKCVLSKKKYYDNENKMILQQDARRRWNCRHQFLFVSEDYAIENEYVSGNATC